MSLTRAKSKVRSVATHFIWCFRHDFCIVVELGIIQVPWLYMRGKLEIPSCLKVLLQEGAWNCSNLRADTTVRISLRLLYMRK